jgi:integrase
VFVATKASLSAALRKGHIDRNPAASAEGVDVDDVDVGDTLPREKFASFIEGFNGHALKIIVTVALRTGARRNEILAIRHSDIDYKSSVLRIARAVERTKAHGTRFKTPKSGKARELTIDAELLALFRREREALARLIAGVPDGAGVDLSLVKIPADALVFWAVPRGESLHFAKPRNDADVSRNFRAHAIKLGYPKLRFHDLRGSHETALLDAGVPVHVVAARCGHSAAMLLRAYAERTQSADTKAADAMAAIFRA